MVNIITDRNDAILFDNKILNQYKDTNLNLHIFISVKKLLLNVPIKYHSMISTFHNKKYFCRFMINNNLEKYIPQLLPFPQSDIPYNEFPVIIKPELSISGSNTHIIKNFDDWNKLKIKRKLYIVQKYIFSDNIYVCHILSNNGKILIGKVYQTIKPDKYYIQCSPIKNYISRDLNDSELSIFSIILKLSNYHGFCSIDYDYENDIIKIFEINPRIGGSLIYNINDFLLFLKLAIDNNVSYV